MEQARAILLVEDNDDDIVLTQRAFARNNIANPLVVARDGAEAIDLLTRDDGLETTPVLVLLDLKLPKLDGFEVLRRLRASPGTRYVPVVMLTSSRSEEDVVSAYDNGANSFIRKPVDFERFLEIVKEIGLYWLILNEVPPT